MPSCHPDRTALPKWGPAGNRESRRHHGWGYNDTMEEVAAQSLRTRLWWGGRRGPSSPPPATTKQPPGTMALLPLQRGRPHRLWLSSPSTQALQGPPVGKQARDDAVRRLLSRSPSSLIRWDPPCPILVQSHPQHKQNSILPFLKGGRAKCKSAGGPTG